MLFDAAHHVGDIFIRFFKEDGSRIQLCDFQKILHEVPDPIELLLGKFCKFLYFRRICRLRLQDSVIDIQSGKGRFQLVGDVGNGVLQEAFRLRLILRVGVQDGNQRVDLMEQTVQPALFIAGDPGVLISRKIISDLRGGFLHDPVLFPEIQIQEREDGKPHSCTGKQHIQRRMFQLQERTGDGDQGEEYEGEQNAAEKAFDFSVGQDFHGVPRFVVQE